ncbi:MAG TPA: hypothetical protein PLO78_03315 [Candidatus Omnitrophota bacterium]|nr:hypothetical protein [Candidatus Omnitrophota bacterium]
MKKIFFVFITALFVLKALPLFAAGPMTGTVLEENSKSVILETDGPESFPVESEIELSYTAGVMEMLIGRFKIVAINGNRYTLEIVSLNMRPSQGMKVNIVPAFNWQPQLVNSQSQPFSSSQKTSVPAKNDVVGEVTGVFGEDVLIELKGNRVPAVDDIAELKYVTAAGMEMEVGTWKVADINGKQVKAVPIHKVTQPRKGLKVTFKLQPKNEEMPFPPSMAVPGFGHPGTGLPEQASSGEKTITLLGVSAVPASSSNHPPAQQESIHLMGVPYKPGQAPAGQAIDQDLFSPTYGQTVSQQKQKRREQYQEQMSFESNKR